MEPNPVQAVPKASEQRQSGPPVQQQQPVQGSRPASADRPKFRPVGVDEIVQTDVVTVERDTPITAVVAKMAEEEVGSIIVVEDDTPVGIITDRAIALSLERISDEENYSVDELISSDLVTGTVDMTVFDAIGRLEDSGIRRLPIVDDDGTLEGIVTLDDLLVILSEELVNATSIIRTQSPRL